MGNARFAEWGIQYLGCFADSWNRAVPTLLSDSLYTNVTIQEW